MHDLPALLGGRFVERRDVKAWQHNDGSYSPDKTPVKLSHIRAHLTGERTLGHYLVDPATNLCRLFAFDLDLRKFALWDDGGIPCDIEKTPKGPVCHVDGQGEHQHFNAREAWLTGNDEEKRLLTNDLIAMAEGLARRTHSLTDLPVAIATSGRKGVHVYAFTGPIDAAEARGAAVDVLESYHCFTPTRGQNFWQHDALYSALEIETFPKQDKVEGEGFGNLMKLPLGVHRITGDRSVFLRVGGPPQGEFRQMDPLEALNGGLPWES